MTYKARRRWSLFILLIGLPLYVVVAVNVVELFERPSILIELAVFVGLGVIWILPLRRVFLGVGREDPAKGAPQRAPNTEKGGPERTRPNP